MDICPICGEPLTVKNWYDDVSLVETRKECECGYVYHWSYGSILEDGVPDEV